MLAALALFTIQANAADEHFEWIKPFDEKITDTVAWDDTELASTLSDYTVQTMIWGPAVIALRHDDRWKRVLTIGVTHGVGAGINQVVKLLSDRTRPNGENTKSFYSGHTSAAFIGAGLTCMMESKEYCATGLGLAALTGYLRIAARWHWFSDVFVGAIIGFAHGRYVPTLFVTF